MAMEVRSIVILGHAFAATSFRTTALFGIILMFVATMLLIFDPRAARRAPYYRLPFLGKLYFGLLVVGIGVIVASIVALNIR